MQNFGQPQRTSILSELPMGNSELGEAFAYIINDMVVQSGITNPKAEDFDVASKAWRNLANKENKTPEDIQKLGSEFKSSVNELAQSYLLFIARHTGNTTGKIDYQQFERFMFTFRFGHYSCEMKPEYIAKIKSQIQNAFNKIAKHGEKEGDDLIDKSDMAAYLYALATRSKRDENNNFLGFEINGFIKPREYAVNENELFAPEDNLFTMKLRISYKVLNGLL